MTTALGGDLVAEINKTQAREVRLALVPGRYLVRKPEGSFVRVGEAVVVPSTLARLTRASISLARMRRSHHAQSMQT